MEGGKVRRPVHKSEVADKGRDWDIEVRGLCKAYGTVKALDGADVSGNFARCTR